VNWACMEVDELSHDVNQLGVAKWSSSWMLNERNSPSFSYGSHTIWLNSLHAKFRGHQTWSDCWNKYSFPSSAHNKTRMWVHRVFWANHT
jgi:hypothetical protein